MTLDTYIRAQMARLAMEEGMRYGGVNNMLAVAQVLRNRVFAGWGGWLEVVARAGEKRGNLAINEAPNLVSNNARILLNRIDDVYTKADQTDMTGGALFYVDPSLPIAEWFKAEVMDKPDEHQRTAHIGPVWFFK